MSSKNAHLRFPSGMTAEQVSKDAKKLQKLQPQLSHRDALDQVAMLHQAPGGYDAGLKLAQNYASYLANRPESPNQQYCVKCERNATVLGGFAELPYCGYHANIDQDESAIPAYKGKIPEGSVCYEAEHGCMEEPTRIIGGACFCDEHYQEAKSGGRRRRLFEID